MTYYSNCLLSLLQDRPYAMGLAFFFFFFPLKSTPCKLRGPYGMPEIDWVCYVQVNALSLHYLSDPLRIASRGRIWGTEITEKWGFRARIETPQLLSDQTGTCSPAASAFMPRTRTLLT